MGLLGALQGDQIYLDTNIWIYALENFAPHSPALEILFQALDQGVLTAITEEFISDTATLSVLPVSRAILIESAKVRARTNIKLPDAIHLATAIQSNCTTFLTNDRQLKHVTDLPVVLLSEAMTA